MGSGFYADPGRQQPAEAPPNQTMAGLLPLHPDVQVDAVLGTASLLRMIARKIDVEDRIDPDPAAQAIDRGSVLRQFQTAIGSDQSAPGQCRQPPTDIGDEPGFRCIVILRLQLRDPMLPKLPGGAFRPAPRTAASGATARALLPGRGRSGSGLPRPIP